MDLTPPKLALFGGTPVLAKPLEESNPIGLGEMEAVGEVLKTGILSGFVAKNNEGFLGGPWVRKLEKYFESYFGVKYAVTFNSATSALFASVYALGIEPGDEILLSPLTMSACATAILFCGGVPVFVDVREDDLCLDADLIEHAISKKTRALLVVHLMGNPAPMDRIMQIASRHRLRVIEDCAQSPGAEFHGKRVGTFGDIGIFSFNRHKVIQSGEGGVAVTDDPELALKLQLIRNHGEEVLDQMPDPKPDVLIGGNFRMTELEAAVAYVQIGRLGALNARRMRLGYYLEQCLSKLPWIRPNKKKVGTAPVYYRFPFRYLNNHLGLTRSTLAQAMKAEGYPLNEGYSRPLHLQSIYQKGDRHRKNPFLHQLLSSERQYGPGLCPVAEKLWREELLLTSLTHVAHDYGDLDLFVTALQKIEANRIELLDYEKTQLEPEAWVLSEAGKI